MKILIQSNWSDKIAALNELTAPNKQAYADLHGYTFENLKLDPTPENEVKKLEILRDRLNEYDAVMTMGCDTIFMNQTIRIEDKIAKETWSVPPGHVLPFPKLDTDLRVIIAREHISWWPINNDVMIWPGIREFHSPSNQILDWLLHSSSEWLRYPWLWQIELWNAMQEPLNKYIRLIEAREMNSCWQQGSRGQWQLGDWILHALDCPIEKRIAIVKAYLQFVGDGTWIPKK